LSQKETIQARSRYNRIAPLYDVIEAPIERWAFSRWRKRLWSQVDGERILEVGVGTGKNMPYYPANAQVTAVDLSEKMLARARQRAQHLGIEVDLQLMDVQQLEFPDATFDAAVASFVFCSIPDPVVGLREVARVVRPGGQLTLLEHVRVNQPVIGPAMDVLDPLVVRMMGAHINRRTAENVWKAGLDVERMDELASGGLVKLIVAGGENKRPLGETGQAAHVQRQSGHTSGRRCRNGRDSRLVGR
jgi:ubiquinone/menaquinone biosynthesis C-methylase UbiE